MKLFLLIAYAVLAGFTLMCATVDASREPQSGAVDRVTDGSLFTLLALWLSYGMILVTETLR